MAISIARIFHSAGFVVVAFILCCLILLTPADAIYQCYSTHRWTNVYFIAGAYIVTFLLALLIYTSRIYTNRSVLAGIPNAWIPIEKEDVGKSVRRLVVEGLVRSAIIAYQARPRDPSTDADRFAQYPTLLIKDPDRPPWGHVTHPGWTSPSSPDLPDLPYRDVIKELPHLIEAKAVSLAPPDLQGASSPSDPSVGEERRSIPDTRAVEALRRPSTMGLREYIAYLTGLNLINPPEVGAEFLALYERARFSSYELEEPEFRNLMRVFADVLQGMTTRNDTEILEEQVRSGSLRSEGNESGFGLSEDDGGDTYTVDRQRGGSRERLHDDGRSAYSLRPPRSIASSWDSRSVYTARSAQSPVSRSRSGNPNPDRLGPVDLPRTPSLRSLRREVSTRSGSSGGSVIRLASYRGQSELPYIIDSRGRHGSRS